MVNHEGKANRRFQHRVQARITPPRTIAFAGKSEVIAARENDANLRHGHRLCRRVDELVVLPLDREVSHRWEK